MRNRRCDMRCSADVQYCFTASMHRKRSCLEHILAERAPNGPVAEPCTIVPPINIATERGEGGGGGASPAPIIRPDNTT